jgi:hypothetical protein
MSTRRILLVEGFVTSGRLLEAFLTCALGDRKDLSFGARQAISFLIWATPPVTASRPFQAR